MSERSTVSKHHEPGFSLPPRGVYYAAACRLPVVFGIVMAPRCNADKPQTMTMARSFGGSPGRPLSKIPARPNTSMVPDGALGTRGYAHPTVNANRGMIQAWKNIPGSEKRRNMARPLFFLVPRGGKNVLGMKPFARPFGK